MNYDPTEQLPNPCEAIDINTLREYMNQHHLFVVLSVGLLKLLALSYALMMSSGVEVLSDG